MKFKIYYLISLTISLILLISACKDENITLTMRGYEATTNDIELFVPKILNDEIKFFYLLKTDVNEIYAKVYDLNGAFIKNIGNLPNTKNNEKMYEIKSNLLDFRGNLIGNGTYVLQVIYKKWENEYFKNEKFTIKR